MSTTGVLSEPLAATVDDMTVPLPPTAVDCKSIAVPSSTFPLSAVYIYAVIVAPLLASNWQDLLPIALKSTLPMMMACLLHYLISDYLLLTRSCLRSCRCRYLQHYTWPQCAQELNYSRSAHTSTRKFKWLQQSERAR